MEDAASFVKEGRHEAAIPKFEEAIRQDPDNAAIYLSLGLSYQALKRYPEAIGAMERAAQLAPNSVKTFYSLALLYEAAALRPNLLTGQNGGPEDRTSIRQQYLSKAKTAWENVLRFETDEKKATRAKFHLAKVTELLK